MKIALAAIHLFLMRLSHSQHNPSVKGILDYCSALSPSFMNSFRPTALSSPKEHADWEI